MGGFLLLVIPGIYLGVLLTFSKLALAIDGLKGIRALAYSRALVQGRWWPVFGRMLGMALISVILSVIPIVGFVLQMLFSIVFAVYMVHLYRDLQRVTGIAPNADHGKTTWLTVAAWAGLLFIPIVLSSVVFVSLMSAREKAADAKAYADMMNAQLEQELGAMPYDDSSMYDDAGGMQMMEDGMVPMSPYDEVQPGFRVPPAE
jgi:hypothetical protein